MRRGLLAFVVAAAVGAPTAVYACGFHGGEAGNRVQEWIKGAGDEAAGVNASGFQVTGTQWKDNGVNGGGQAGHWNANDWYQVTITFPGGSPVVTIKANPVNFPGGAEIEAWLENEAKKIIINAAPPDKANADFVG